MSENTKFGDTTSKMACDDPFDSNVKPTPASSPSGRTPFVHRRDGEYIISRLLQVNTQQQQSVA